MTRTIFFIILAHLYFLNPAFAEKVESLDFDKDGRNETTYYYDDYGSKVRGELDKDGDGKAERIVYFKNGKRFRAENDRDRDGIMDSWDFYTSKGVFSRSARDTNKDGKPDQFKAMLKGREVVLKEYDRNFDGRIDRRQLEVWGARKMGYGMPPVPGYMIVWKEEDNDFDGKIDTYREKGNKDAAKKKKKIGTPIDIVPSLGPEELKPKPTVQKKNAITFLEEDRIKKLNERHGL